MARRVRSRADNTVPLLPLPTEGTLAPTPKINYGPGKSDILPNQVLHTISRGPNPVYPDLPGDPAKGSDLEKYALLARYSTVATGLESMRDQVFWPGWHIKAVNDHKRYPQFAAWDMEVKDFLETDLKSLQHRCGESFTTKLGAAYDHVRIFGNTVGECFFTDPRKVGRASLTNIKIKNPTLLYWETDINGDLLVLWYTRFSYPVYQPVIEQKFAIGVWPYLRDGQWYGESELVPVERDIAIAMLMDNSFGKIAQRTANRTALHYYSDEDRSKDELADTRDKILNLNEQEVISLKAQLSMSTSGNGEMVVKDLIKYIEGENLNGEALRALFDSYKEALKRINRRFAQPDDLGMSGSTTGSNARAKTEFNYPMARAKYGQDWIANYANGQIIRKLVRYNFPHYFEHPFYLPPEFTFGPQDEDADAVEAQSARELFEKGVITRREARERLNYPPEPEEGDDTWYRPPAPAGRM